MSYREEILEFINEVIIENHGEESPEDTVVRETGIDSFGFAVIWLELDDKYGCFDNEYLKSISNEAVAKIRISDLIDRIEQCTSKDTSTE